MEELNVEETNGKERANCSVDSRRRSLATDFVNFPMLNKASTSTVTTGFVNKFNIRNDKEIGLESSSSSLGKNTKQPRIVSVETLVNPLNQYKLKHGKNKKVHFTTAEEAKNTPEQDEHVTTKDAEAQSDQVQEQRENKSTTTTTVIDTCNCKTSGPTIIINTGSSLNSNPNSNKTELQFSDRNPSTGYTQMPYRSRLTPEPEPMSYETCMLEQKKGEIKNLEKQILGLKEKLNFFEKKLTLLKNTLSKKNSEDHSCKNNFFGTKSTSPCCQSQSNCNRVYQDYFSSCQQKYSGS